MATLRTVVSLERVDDPSRCLTLEVELLPEGDLVPSPSGGSRALGFLVASEAPHLPWDRWQAFILSGVGFALRSAVRSGKGTRLADRALIVRDARGSLEAEDADGVAIAASCALLRLLDEPDPPGETEGWRVLGVEAG